MPKLFKSHSCEEVQGGIVKSILNLMMGCDEVEKFQTLQSFDFEPRQSYRIVPFHHQNFSHFFLPAATISTPQKHHHFCTFLLNENVANYGTEIGLKIQKLHLKQVDKGAGNEEEIYLKCHFVANLPIKPNWLYLPKHLATLNNLSLGDRVIVGGLKSTEIKTFKGKILTKKKSDAEDILSSSNLCQPFLLNNGTKWRQLSVSGGHFFGSVTSSSSSVNTTTTPSLMKIEPSKYHAPSTRSESIHSKRYVAIS